MITEEIFKNATGFEAQDDDIERCNCQKAGQDGHIFCGWNKELNQPVFYGGIDYSKVEKGYYRVNLNEIS